MAASTGDLADLQTRQLSILISAMQRGLTKRKSCLIRHARGERRNSAVVEKAMSLDQSFRIVDLPK